VRERRDETGVGMTIEVAARRERAETTMTETTAMMKTTR
jgi:hypothetical protein